LKFKQIFGLDRRMNLKASLC